MLCPRCTREIPDDAALCCYCGRVIIRKKPTSRRPNGNGTIYKRNNTWTVRITVALDVLPDGSLRQVFRSKGGFATRAEAADYVPILKAQTEKAKKAPTLRHYWDLYEKTDLAQLSVSKAVAYRGAWRKLHALEHRAVDTLTVKDLRETVSAQATTYYPARDMKNLLSHLFRLAGADGWVSKDLPSYILLPPLKEAERRPFTDEEQKALWHAWENGTRSAALPLIMIYTGMMPGELMGLTVDMIDLDARKIIGAGKKTKVRRESPVYLPDAILPVLSTLMEAAPADGHIAPRHEKAFYPAYYGALEAAGCRRLEPYCCRHTTATALAIDRQIAPQTIQRIMRWSSTRMLDRYAHPDDADILAALDADPTHNVQDNAQPPANPHP